MIRLGCLLLCSTLALLIAIPVVASHYLPWGKALLVVAAELLILCFAGPLLFRWIVKRIFARIIGVKSKVLRHAQVQIHSVDLVPRPARRTDPTSTPQITTPDGTIVEDAPTTDTSDHKPDEPGTRYVRIVCTITPSATPDTPMRFYEPDDLLLVPFNKRVSLLKVLKQEDQGLQATLYESSSLPDTGDKQPLDDKITGPHRLELTFQCPPTLQGRVKFQYYFESFGDLQLPG